MKTKWKCETHRSKAKPIEQAELDLWRLSKSTKEITGIVGGESSEWMTMAIFGGVTNPHAVKLADEVGERYGWTITKDNAAAILFDMVSAVEEAKKTVPVYDKRRTPDEETQRAKEYREAEEKRHVELEKHAAEVEKHLAELKRLYPWAKQDGSHWARAAYNAKQELSRTFPGVQFRAKSESYSMGNHVDIYWDMGPSEKTVQAILWKYTEGSFDGMIDLYENDHSAYGSACDKWLGRSKYVSGQRCIEESTLETLGRMLCEKMHREYTSMDQSGLWGDGDHRSLWVHTREMVSKVDFPAGAVITGVGEWKQEDQTWEVLYDVPATAQAPDIEPAIKDDTGVTVTFNAEKNGIELRFPVKPESGTLEALKSHGWRWSRFNSCWYNRDTTQAREFAQGLTA